MQKAKEAAPETKAECDRCLRLELQCSVIELQLFQGIPQIRILCPVRRIQSAVYHRVYLLVARKCFGTRARHLCHRIADTRLPHIFQARRQIAYHPGRELLARNKLACAKEADLYDIRLSAGRHHPDPRPLADASILDTHKYDNTLVGIIHRVKNERL